MRRFRSLTDKGGSGDAAIDMSPILDCVFILLIFFIVTTSFVEETGVDVDKPQAASSVNLDKNSILIAITEEGAIVYGGREIGIGGVRPLVARMLQQEELPVIVQADQSVKSGLLVQVIDEAKLGGANKVSIATAKRRQ